MAFISEARQSDSPVVEMVWRTQGTASGPFLSPAAIHWELVVMHHEGRIRLLVHGPETQASAASVVPEAEWLGITFKLGTFMPDLLPKRLLNRQDVYLPEAAGRAFWLGSAAWEVPDYDNADTFADWLMRRGRIVHDPLVDDVMQAATPDVSPRTVQVRFQRATGMTRKTVQQIQRAQQAAALLTQGCSILDTVYQLGYFDQSHLTNALRRYRGQTPAQIAAARSPD